MVETVSGFLCIADEMDCQIKSVFHPLPDVVCFRYVVYHSIRLSLYQLLIQYFRRMILIVCRLLCFYTFPLCKKNGYEI